MTEVSNQDGFYWKDQRKMPTTWVYRFQESEGMVISQEDAIYSLKQLGAVNCVDVTNEGGAAEFGKLEEVV